MEVVLLQDVDKLGTQHQIVKVKPGYARNFLIPQKKAMLATADAKAVVEEKRRQLADDEAGRLAEAQSRADKSVKEIHLVRLCGEEGQLYGSVSPMDIAEAMTAAGSETEKSEVTQPDGPIKHVGDFEADVILHPEVRFTVKIVVEGEKGDGNPVDAEVAPADSEESE